MHAVTAYSDTWTNLTTNHYGPVKSVDQYMRASHPMTKLAMIVKRVAGATNTVSVNMEISMDGTTFVTISGLPDPQSGAPKAVTNLLYGPAHALMQGIPFCYFRYWIQNIGVGNTLEIQMLASR